MTAPNPYDVECPLCHAGLGEACINRNRHLFESEHTQWPHRERVTAARIAATPDDPGKDDR